MISFYLHVSQNLFSTLSVTLAVMSHPIILFDGICNFCEGTVKFVLQRDKHDVFRFASLQSEIGQQYLQQFGLSTTDLDTFVLVEGNTYTTRSTAGLRVLRHLPFPWNMAYVFIILPGFIRDTVYKLVARNRYKIWGKKDECMLPTPEMRAKFIG
jgi:predicted DCC family thiol-disulfide oxidoreductase YuxK